MGWKGPEPKVAHVQQHCAQTLAWDLSMLPLMPSCCVLLGSRAWCGILQVFHNSAKAQHETEPCGLRLGQGCAVTPACDTVELRSGDIVLQTLRLGGYLLPKEWGRVCTEALLQGCRGLLFNSAGDPILETKSLTQPLTRI